MGDYIFIVSSNIRKSSKTISSSEGESREYPLLCPSYCFAQRCYFFMQVLPVKIVSLRYNRLHRVINLMKELERHFLEIMLPRSITNKDVIYLRTVMGIFIIFFLVRFKILKFQVIFLNCNNFLVHSIQTSLTNIAT